jgi:Outer membrane protein beta-barrel domain
MKKVLLLVILAFFAESVIAQSFYSRRIDRKWVVSVGSGLASYFGELKNPGEVFNGTLYNIEVGAERRINERISVRGNLTFFQTKGSDAVSADPSRIPRNLSFISSNFEMAAIGIVQLFPEVGRYYQRPLINPYIFLGIGGTYFNAKAALPDQLHDGTPVADAGKKTSLRQYRTELIDYSPVTVVIPFGVGVKMVIAPTLNISINGGYRYTGTDYLDDVSTVNVGTAAFSDPLAAALSDRAPEIGLEPRPIGAIRGNPDKNDGYFIFSVRVDYYLPPGIFGGGSSKKRRGYRGSKRRDP